MTEAALTLLLDGATLDARDLVAVHDRPLGADLDGVAAAIARGGFAKLAPAGAAGQ